MTRFYRGAARGAVLAVFLLILTTSCGCKGVDFFWFEVRDLDGKAVYTVHPCIDLKGLEHKGLPELGVSEVPEDERPGEEKTVPRVRK
jgi:hypothetical protein